MIQLKEWRDKTQIFANHVSNTGFVSRIFKYPQTLRRIEQRSRHVIDDVEKGIDRMKGKQYSKRSLIISRN